MKYTIKILVLISPLLFIACGSSSSCKKELIKGELLLDISAKEMKTLLSSEGMAIDEDVYYGYKAYKISYVTKDDKGKCVNASGLFVIPTELSPKLKEDGLSLVSWSHGTITLNEEAPTVYTKKYQKADFKAMVFSSLGGFATLQADYIGYGDSSSHYHPYIVKKSLVNSSIDLIEATRQFAQENNITLNEKLFVSGYSEGGYGAMAIAQKLEEMGKELTASTPLAGDYNLNYTANTALGFNEENLTAFSSTYFAMVSLAYSKVYDKNLSIMVNSPYDSQIETLLDGNHSFEQIENALPSKSYGSEGLFRSDFIEEYRNNNESWFKKALAENSIDIWSPRSPIHIVHCEGDDDASYLGTQKFYKNMIDGGAKNVKLITPDKENPNDEKWNHDECFVPAITYSVLWFLEKRDNTPGKYLGSNKESAMYCPDGSCKTPQ